MNTPGYDFDGTVRRLRAEEMRLLLDELARMAQDPSPKVAEGAGGERW